MWQLLISLTTLLAGTSALGLAAAQTVQHTSPAAWNTQTVAAPTDAPPPAGFVLPSGVTFVPVAFSELGYDTNPSQTFNNQQGSGFIRTGGSFSLSSVSPGLVANLNASGSMLDYFNSTIFDEPLRFAGAASGNVTYLIQPGVTISPSAFINYDGQSVNRNQNGGANVELALRDPVFSSVLRGRFLDVQYLNNDSLLASPISLGSQFNYNRSEVTWSGLLGNHWLVLPYAAASAARVDYPNQPDPALIDRSADDYSAKAGVRWPISPFLSTDIGWRFNQRNTDDHRITSFNSNFFDGSLTWQPSPAFSFKASVERFIGEPATNPAILSDVRSYSLKTVYVPVAGVAVSAAGGWQIVTDIGSGVHYDAPFADAQATWGYNNHVQFYTGLHYQGYNLDRQSLSYNDFRLMTGVRIIPDGQELLPGESLESLFVRLADARRPLNSELTVSGGYSWFGLPDMKMATVVGGPLFDQALRQQTNGDGNLNGWRTDARLANFAEGAWLDGRPLSFGMSGFFANYEGTTKSHCMYTVTTDCAIVNIVDFNPWLPNNTGPFGNLNVTASRDVNYWGVALDARLGGWLEGGLKDGSPLQALSPFKLGVAVRGINETAKLTSIDPLVSDPVRYKEKLDTFYYGGFAGIERKQALGDGWIAGIDATAGVYYTSTDFQGRYNGYTLNLPSGYVQESGWVNSSFNTSSFIGTVRLDVKRELGWGTVGVFGQGEYLSFVPRIVYNNNDQAAGVLFGGISGTQNGTRITSSDAFNFTTGLSLSVPLD